MNKKPLVSSLSISFRKAVLPESVEEAKQEHRTKLHGLVEKYMEDVQNGKVEGIRNAKDLIEVMKMDLLLMGEATDRTEQNSSIDEVRISKVAQSLDFEDPEIKDLLASVYSQFNQQNDDEHK